jgi:hypothetical protein
MGSEDQPAGLDERGGVRDAIGRWVRTRALGFGAGVRSRLAQALEARPLGSSIMMRGRSRMGTAWGRGAGGVVREQAGGRGKLTRVAGRGVRGAAVRGSWAERELGRQTGRAGFARKPRAVDGLAGRVGQLGSVWGWVRFRFWAGLSYCLGFSLVSRLWVSRPG